MLRRRKKETDRENSRTKVLRKGNMRKNECGYFNWRTRRKVTTEEGQIH